MERKSKLTIKITIFCVLIVAYLVSLLFAKQIEGLINTSTHSVNKEGAVVQTTDTQIHYIDVGQGDCTVIELPNNKLLMIDTGIKSKITQLKNYLDEVIFDNAVYNNSIDYLILTHTDADHIGGAVSIINSYEIKTIYRPNLTVPTTSKMWKNTVAAIEDEVPAEKIIYTDKDTPAIVYDDPNGTSRDYSFSFYAPIQESFSNNNDYSPFMIFKIGAKTFMFTGDASDSIEKDVLDYYASDLSILDVDVLKAGHHGSGSSSCEEFLQATTPKYAVISCGKDNSYGHPHNDTIERFTNIGAAILRTDTSGTILAFVNDDNEINFIADYFEPNTYYIEWWYCGLTILAAVGAGLFVRKGKRYSTRRTDR